MCWLESGDDLTVQIQRYRGWALQINTSLFLFSSAQNDGISPISEVRSLNRRSKAMMIRSVLRSTLKPCYRRYAAAVTVTVNSYSTAGKRISRRERRRVKPEPAAIDEAQFEATVASLPARFTPGDVSALLSREGNPLLCVRVLFWFTHHSRFKPDPDPFLVTIKRLGAARMFVEMDSVASLAMSMPGLPLCGSLYNTLIYFYLEAGKLGKAFHVYTLMFKSRDPAAQPTTHTYSLLFTALLNRCSKNSYVQFVYMDNIRALFRQMIELGIKPDLLCLNSLIKGYGQSMHLNDALRIFHQMQPVYGLEPDGCTYSYLIHGLCAQGRTKNARELFDEMTEKKLVLNSRASNSIVSALAIEGEIEDAMRIMWELGAMGRVMDGITCRALIGEICRPGKLKEAKELVWEMAEKGVMNQKLRRELLLWIEDEFSDNCSISRSRASSED